jgi:dTDP-glucose 4,6-dehydratase
VGFIGSNFVRMITNRGLEGISGVKVLDKLTYAGVKENLTPIVNVPNYHFKQGHICDSGGL